MGVRRNIEKPGSSEASVVAVESCSVIIDRVFDFFRSTSIDKVTVIIIYGI